MALQTAELNFHSRSLYLFKNQDLFEQALRHRSRLGDMNGRGLGSYERLEFLGDAVIDAALSHILFLRFPNDSEGQLSRKRAFLVSKESFSKKAQECQLAALVQLGRSMKDFNSSVLADVFEALMACLYLESGLEKLSEVLAILFEDELRLLKEDLPLGCDAKSELQEILQAELKIVPSYEVLESSGSIHDPIFKVGLFVQGQLLGVGVGKNKKSASIQAATLVLAFLRKEGLSALIAPGKKPQIFQTKMPSSISEANL